MRTNNKRVWGDSPGTARRLAAHSAVAAAALTAACCMIAAAMLFSGQTLNALERELVPLLDAGIAAEQSGDAEAALENSLLIAETLHSYRQRLELIANHRDLSELLRLSDEACLAVENGGGDRLAALNGILAILDMLIGNDRVTIGSLL